MFRRNAHVPEQLPHEQTMLILNRYNILITLKEFETIVLNWWLNQIECWNWAVFRHVVEYVLNSSPKTARITEIELKLFGFNEFLRIFVSARARKSEVKNGRARTFGVRTQVVVISRKKITQNFFTLCSSGCVCSWLQYVSQSSRCATQIIVCGEVNFFGFVHF